MLTRLQSHFILLSMLGCWLTTDAHAEWPALRGPRVDGHAATSSLLKTTDDVTLKTKWQQELGSGYSSIVVAGDHIVTMYCDDKFGYVVCLSAETGEEIWKHNYGEKFIGTNGSFDGPIATPCISDGKVFALTPKGSFLALSINTGALLWSVNLPEKLKVQPFFYGFGTSPIVSNGKIYLLLGAPVGMLAAFNPANGDVVWSAGEDVIAYQNVMLADLAGTSMLVAAGTTKVTGFHAETGDELWSFEHEGTGGRGAMSLIPVPLPDDGLLLLHDDVRSRAITIKANNGEFTVEPTWNERIIRNSYNVPVVIGDNIYAYSSRILMCVDARSGELQWRSRDPGDGFISVVDDHLILLTKEGSLHVARPSTSGYDEITSLQVLDDVAWSIPAVSENAIYIRSLSGIARVDLIGGEAETQVATEKSITGPRFQAFLDRVAQSSDKQAAVDDYLAGQKSFPIIEGDIVHFVLTGDYADVAVSSDIFASRQERKLEHIDGTNLFYYGAKIPTDTRASYVFIADFKYIPDPRNPRKIKSSIYIEDFEFVFLTGGETLVMSWFDMPKRKPSFDPTSAQITLKGELTEFSLESDLTNSVIKYDVYTPPNYSKQGDRYPVVFVQDAAGAVTLGRLPEVVDHLITTGEIRPCVVVFIKEPFNPMMPNPNYGPMLAGELIPTIDVAYHVSRELKDRAMTGSLFGGVLAMGNGLFFRDKVGKIAVNSGMFFEMTYPIIQGGLQVPGPKPEVMLTWGKYDLTNPVENFGIGANSREVAGMLKQAGFQVETAEFNDGSDWICWRSRAIETWSFLVGK